VGPLANPAMAGRQLVGVADERRVPLLAGALRELGTHHALVVHGTGMDEISPLAATQVIEIRGGSVTEWTVDPRASATRDCARRILCWRTARRHARSVLAVCPATRIRLRAEPSY